MSEILKIENLSVSFSNPLGEIEAIRDISFSLEKGEVLAIVGESGSGKSVLLKTLTKLLPENAFIKNGKITANGKDITNLKSYDVCKKLFSMVFQNPMTALNPTLTIGRQLKEGIKGKDKTNRAIHLLELVGIENPKEALKRYPESFSGGMRQRIVLAIALSKEPEILLLDEPTTALDVTVQGKILDLILSLQKKLKTSVIFVSHDMGAVSKIADRVLVMYGGKIVEAGTKDDIFFNPCHPYTVSLIKSIPYFAEKEKKLFSIPGMPPVLINPPKGDVFAERNKYAMMIDYEEMPPMFKISDTHYAATWLLDERAPKIDLRGREDV